MFPMKKVRTEEECDRASTETAVETQKAMESTESITSSTAKEITDEESVNCEASGKEDVGSEDCTSPDDGALDTNSSAYAALKIETVFSLVDNVLHNGDKSSTVKTDVLKTDTGQRSNDFLQDSEMDRTFNNRDTHNVAASTDEANHGNDSVGCMATVANDDIEPFIKTEPLSPSAEEFQTEVDLSIQNDIKVKIEPPGEFQVGGDTINNELFCSESDRRPNRKRKPNQIFSDSYILSYKGNSLLRDVTVTLDEAKNAQKRQKSSCDSNQRIETNSKSAKSVKSKSVKSEIFEFEQIDQNGYSRTCLPEVMLRNRMDVLAASVKRKKDNMYKDVSKRTEEALKKKIKSKSSGRSTAPSVSVRRSKKFDEGRAFSSKKSKMSANSVPTGKKSNNAGKDIPLKLPRNCNNSAIAHSLTSPLPAGTKPDPNVLSPLFDVLDKQHVRSTHCVQNPAVKGLLGFNSPANNDKRVMLVTDGKSTVQQSQVYNDTVKELAKLQNTRKFFQLVIGSKIVLIPTNDDVIVPKAYVVDMEKDKTTANIILNGGKKVDPPAATAESGGKDTDNLPPPVLYPQTPVVTAKTTSPECSPPTLQPEVILSPPPKAKSRLNSQLPNIISKSNSNAAKSPDKNRQRSAPETARLTDLHKCQSTISNVGCQNKEDHSVPRTDDASEDVSERIRKLRERFNAQQKDVENARKSIEKIKNANILDV